MTDTTPHPTPPEPDATDTTEPMLPVAEAAAALGITSDAVRARIRRGKMHGEKRDNVWFVSVPDEGKRDTTPDLDTTKPDREKPRRDTERDTRETVASADTTEPPANTTDATTDATGPALVALVDKLREENAQLLASAVLLLSRNAHLEEQLRQLNAGGDADDATDGPQSAGENRPIETYRARTETRLAAILGRLRAWLTRAK